MKTCAGFVITAFFALLIAAQVRAADGALDFSSASQQRVEVSNFQGLGISTEVTVEFWLLTTRNDVAQSVFSLNPDTVTSRFQCQLYDLSGNTYWDFGDISTGGRVQVPARAEWLNNWTHFALVASQREHRMTIYANGQEVASVLTYTVLQSVSALTKLSIGGIAGTYFQGKIDDFRVWNVARTQAEIFQNLGGTLTGNEEGLKLYFKFDEGTGMTAINSAIATGSAYNGTLLPVASMPARTSPARKTYVVTNTSNSGIGSLRQSIMDAASDPGPALVTFAPALDGRTISLSGPNQGSAITFADLGGVTIDAASLPSGLTISDGSNTNHRLFYVSVGTSLVLRSLTLANGGGGNFQNDGAAIYNADTLTMEHCTILGGSAIHGGAIYNSRTLTLRQCALSGNVSSGSGGAIYNNNVGMLTLTQNTLSGNSSSYKGGAIFNNGGPMTMAACTLSDNSANSYGGAISSLGPLTLTQCAFSGNSATNGGAIYCVFGLLTQCTLSGNSGVEGGAIFLDQDLLTLAQCTLTGNTASTNGGAISVRGSATLSHCTVSGNSSNGTLGGGGAYVGVGQSLLLENSIVAGNTLTGTGSGDDIYNGGTFTRTGANLVQLVAGTGAESGPAAIDAAPLLAPLASNGGPTPTMALLPGSPCLDAAEDSTATTDQRGLPRTRDGDGNGSATPDLGAYEAQAIPTGSNPNPIFVTIAADENDPVGILGTGLSLREAVTLAPDGADIFFDAELSGQTLTLGSEILLTEKNVTIDASSLPTGVMLNGGPDDNRILFIARTVTLKNLNLTDGGGTGLFGSGKGGAIFTSGAVTLEQCTLSKNHANIDGGAIYNIGTLTLTQCTFAGNSAGAEGGAIANDGTLSLTQCTLSVNSVNISGGAVANYGTLTLTYSLIAGNTANSSGRDIFFAGGTIITTGVNLIGNTSDSSLNAGPNVIVNPSPRLAPLGHYGGPTQTIALLPGSPAVNAATGSTITNDQRGFSINGTPDIGAYEFRGKSTGAGYFVTETLDSGPGSLRQALTNAANHAGADVVTLLPDVDGGTLILQSELLVNDITGTVTIDGSALGNGFALTDRGDVNYRLLHVQSGSTLIVKGVSFLNGGGASFTGVGGGILNNGTLTLERCMLTSCVASLGGAIANEDTQEGETLVTLTECTLMNNTASGGGGAIYNRDVGSNVDTHLVLTGCTFANNLGGGSSIQSDTFGLLPHLAIQATNCTFSGDLLNLTGRPDFLRPVASFTHCTIAGTGSGITVVDTIYGGRPVRLTNSIVSRVTYTIKPIQVGGNIIGGDPLLAPLGNYGGPTQTMPPLPLSLAIDQARDLTPAVTTDQRGQPRPLGAHNDIGAVEGSVVVVTTPVDELDAPGSPGNGVSLREAVRDVPVGGTIVFDRAVFNSTATNTITLTKGPLNPQRNCTLNGSLIPGGISIVHTPTITAQPQPQGVASGAAASFTVTVTNLSGGLAYLWRKDGSDLITQTAATLNLSNVTEADEALYDVTLSEAASPGAFTLTNVNLTPASGRSQPASLIVDSAPVAIKRGPQSAMLALGSNYTLSVNAVGPALPALTYQWRRNGVNLSGATKSSYTITNAQLAHAGAYTCLVRSGTALPGLTSITAEIGVVDTKAKTVNLALNAKFIPTVSAAGNGLTYGWRRDSTVLASTTKTFTINAVSAGDEGTYFCTVSGLAGVITTGFNTNLNVITAAPQFVKPLEPPTAVVGQAYFYQLPQVAPTTNRVATSFSVIGALPPGLSLNTSTGIVSGRPTMTKSGGYAVTFKATNLKSSDSAPATINVLTMPEGSIGTFAGPAARSTLNDNLGGRLDLTTTAAGLFSGSVTLGARAKISFINQLLLSQGDGDVVLRGNLTNITMADKTPLVAYVEVFASDQYARLTLTHPNGTMLVIPAWRNTWNSSTNKATAYATKYSARLDTGTGGTVSPDGYGFITFAVGTTGSLTLGGKLPDNTLLTGAPFVGPNGEVLVFQLLYANKGSLVGQFTLASASLATNNTLIGTMSWMKLAQTATSTDTIYKAGFGPLTVTAQGGTYVAPLAGQRVMGAPVALMPNTNSTLSCDLGGLAADFTQAVRIACPNATSFINTATIAAYNGLLMPNPNPNRVVMPTLTASSGAFSGSFMIEGGTTALNRTAPFYGQIVKIGATTQGYGFFLLPSVPVAPKTVATSPRLSGRVQFTVP